MGNSEALRAAINAGETGVVKFLLDLEGPLDAREGLLHQACALDRVEIARLLLGHCEVNAPDAQQDTAMHLCSSAEMAALLIKAGADPSLENGRGLRPDETVKNGNVSDYLKDCYLQRLGESEAAEVELPWDKRFRYEFVSIKDLEPTAIKEETFKILFDGQVYGISNRFINSFAHRLAFTPNIFRYFTPTEVFTRVAERNQDVRFRVTFDEQEHRLLGVVEENKQLLPPQIACEIFSADPRLSDLIYSDGVFKAKFETPERFSIYNDSDYQQILELNFPVDGLGDPSIFLGVVRQICTNGMVARVAEYRTNLVVGDRHGTHLQRMLNSFSNDYGFNELKERLKVAQQTAASVSELLEVENLITGYVQPKDLANQLVSRLEEISGDPCGRYGITSLNNIAKGRRPMLRAGCSVNALFNFLTELGTHHGEYVEGHDSFGANRINRYIGHKLTAHFDLEDLESWHEPTEALMLEQVQFPTRMQDVLEY